MFLGRSIARSLSRSSFSISSSCIALHAPAVAGSIPVGRTPSIVTAIVKRSFSMVTPEEARQMPKFYYEMPNEVLLTMAVMGDQEAREERMIREIMAVDNVTWHDAQPIFQKMVESNRKGLFLATLPYKIGIAAAVGTGFLTIPLCFEYHTVLWFNELFVTTDVPDARDLETPLEVGAFAWNWMEPPLGQVSFFLLCMQFARAQLENLGAKPYTRKFLALRAKRLISEFPHYNKYIVESFSEGDSLSGGDGYIHSV